MTNPFEAPDALYLVLRNDELQYSLWPSTSAVPAGWDVQHGPAARAACIEHIETHWTDMRPRSLVAAMQKDAAD